MKTRILSLFVLVSAALQAQIVPEYRVLAPEVVVMNHRCMEVVSRQIFQDGNAISDPEDAYLNQMISDEAGNIYVLGRSNFDRQGAGNASRDLTLGSNTSLPNTFSPLDDHFWFLAKYQPDGVPLWANFFTEEPVNMLYDSMDQRVYVIFNASGNGLKINGYTFSPDSNNTNKAIYEFKSDNGEFSEFYRNPYTYDLQIVDGRKVLIYLRQFTSTYFEVRYGFMQGNQVKKWQMSLNGTTAMPADLFYNPYQKKWWYKSGLDYFRLSLHPTQDSIIAENVRRPLYSERIPPYMVLSPVNKFHFTADGNCIGELLGQSGDLNYTHHLVKFDTVGNQIWRIRMHKAEIAIDRNGDVWIDHRVPSYFNKVQIQSLEKEYRIVPYGNIGFAANFLWRMDGKTGDLKEAYFNGYGNVNAGSYLPGKVIHVTSDNQLITNPQMGSIAYYPNENGVFDPYYTLCNNAYIPSQFTWVSYDLNRLKSFKHDQTLHTKWFDMLQPGANFSVSPNPSKGHLVLRATNSDHYRVFSSMGALVAEFNADSEETSIHLNHLPSGLYFIRNERGETIKLMMD